MPDATGTIRKHCRSLRRDGQPCTAPALPDSTYCYAHDPDRAAERDAARSKGGRNKANIVRLRGLAPPRLLPIFDTLEAALTEVHDGDLTPPQATAMAALARALTAVLTAGETEERLRQIEARLAEGEAAQWRA